MWAKHHYVLSVSVASSRNVWSFVVGTLRVKAVGAAPSHDGRLCSEDGVLTGVYGCIDGPLISFALADGGFTTAEKEGQGQIKKKGSGKSSGFV